MDFPEAGIDFDRANAARMYDYFLGGAHNFQVDRDQAAKVLAAYPDVVHLARANRAFLGRAVRWCLQAGIDQFLDLGSGVPTVGNVHDIAHTTHPHARVAYVDFEPVAVAHARDLLAGLDTVTITHADLRIPRQVLDAPGVTGLIDFTRPVALLAVAVLHFVTDDLAAILDRYRTVLAPGSAIVISHASDDQDDPAVADHMRAAAAAYRGSATEATLRSRDQITALLHGLHLVAPGLVDITDWPTTQPHVPTAGGYGALALQP